MNYITLAVWLLRELEVVVGGGGWYTGDDTTREIGEVGEPVDVVVIDREVESEHATDDKQ